MSCPTYAPRSWLLALRFDYVRRQLDLDAEAGPFPEAIRSVVDAVQGMPQITHALDQLTVNEYPAGVGLAPHIDSHTSFDDCIAILVREARP